MIYFYTQGMNDLQSKFSDRVDAFNDIYNSVVEKFYAKYDLPALHLWENGFNKGDASEEELKGLADKGLIEYIEDDKDYDFEKLDQLLLSEIETEIEKKTICVDLNKELRNLVKDAEGCGFSGWICPIWAKTDDNDLILSLGAPVSRNTSFMDSDKRTPLSWIGNIDCWSLDADENDWEYYGFSNKQDFDLELVLDNEVDRIVENIERADDYLSDIKESLTLFLNSKGFRVYFD